MPDLFSLAGKTAMVTGAAGGLGAHFCRTLGHAGAAVVLAGRRIEPLRQLAAELRESGVAAHPLSLDVTDAGSVRAGFEQAEALCGVVDIAVCNAGTTVTKNALALDPSEWDQVLDVNLKGCWQVASEAARRLVAASRPGAIINVSSILGHRVAGNVLPYAVSKAGLEQMTRALALEWARHGIRVNALAPGYVETDLNRDFFASEAGAALIRRIPQRRLGRACELDGALLLLASDASAYMTGSSIVVDGGHLQSTL
jgi:NAD(P)-dependent dehydrogenase (short-subunit alcohol dehydrogenase family)